MKSVCVFCGSSLGRVSAYAEAARAFGAELARRDLTLVWGGGNVGLMGVLADAVIDGGGRAIGVIPFALAERELAHSRASEMHVVRTMHERKARMAQLADAFVALPGGFGTLDEMCEILTWAQLGIHAKPCGILDVERYFEHLRALIEHAVHEGFVQDEQREMLVVDDDAARLLDRLAKTPLRTTPQWVEP